MSLLEIKNLQIGYREGDEMILAIDGVDLSIQAGQTLGIVGESGSGKSTVIKSIVDILDSNGKILDGSIKLNGSELLDMEERRFNNEVRWSQISYVPQDAMAALDPVYQLGTQIVEVIREHTSQTKRDARKRAQELLSLVGLDDSTIYDYPHELSGGQRQRGVIALALALRPSVILADEPTTGLDVVIQDEILKLLVDIQEELGCAIVMVTHDMSVVADIADKTAVMYGGRIMEYGSTVDIFNRSIHPYTIGLKNAFPSITPSARERPLIDIPGTPPNLRAPPSGCRFSERCPFATSRCTTTEPPMISESNNQYAKCHYTDQAHKFRKEGASPQTWHSGEDAR